MVLKQRDIRCDRLCHWRFALILEEQPWLKPQQGGNSSCLIQVKQALVDSLSADAPAQHDSRGGYGQLDANAWYQETRTISAC